MASAVITRVGRRIGVPGRTLVAAGCRSRVGSPLVTWLTDRLTLLHLKDIVDI
jgi:hypothetical protein